MSGHSKWHNIRVKKTAADVKRGKVYTRHAKLIQIAAQKGGDPDMNPSLRTAIDNAKADNVPNANIDRAIQKGTGAAKGAGMEEVLYAAMGPGSVALLIECLTDNKNRTLSNVKMIVSKNGGAFAESASVLWMFRRAGRVIAQLQSGMEWNDEYELRCIDAGADEVEVHDGVVTIITDMTTWTAVRDALTNMGCEIAEAGIGFVATQHAEVDEATAAKVLSLVEALEEDDDVSHVHTNMA